ncbi:MAG: PD-(D/E)XK nuclease family protein [Anaerolineaceae bacterium]
MTVAKEFTFSQSSMQSYLNCPYQFYLKYVRHLDWPSALLDPWNPAEVERQSGIRFHQLVHNHFLGVKDTLLEKHAQQDSDPKMADWLSNFKNSALIPEGESTYPELLVYASLAGYNFSAKFDLLLLSDKNIHIFDWKTSKCSPKAEWLRKRVQTHLYPLLAISEHQRSFPGNNPLEIIFTYWEASFPDQPIQFTFEQADIQFAQKIVINLASEITAKPLESFNKTARIERCNYCLFRTYCQRPTANSYNLELEHELLFSGQDIIEISEEN